MIIGAQQNVGSVAFQITLKLISHGFETLGRDEGRA
jgi:hypothetical protein